MKREHNHQQLKLDDTNSPQAPQLKRQRSDASSSKAETNLLNLSDEAITRILVHLILDGQVTDERCELNHAFSFALCNTHLFDLYKDLMKSAGVTSLKRDDVVKSCSECAKSGRLCKHQEVKFKMKMIDYIQGSKKIETLAINRKSIFFDRTTCRLNEMKDLLSTVLKRCKPKSISVRDEIHHKPPLEQVFHSQNFNLNRVAKLEVESPLYKSIYNVVNFKNLKKLTLIDLKEELRYPLYILFQYRSFHVHDLDIQYLDAEFSGASICFSVFKERKCNSEIKHDLFDLEVVKQVAIMFNSLPTSTWFEIHRARRWIDDIRPENFTDYLDQFYPTEILSDRPVYERVLTACLSLTENLDEGEAFKKLDTYYPNLLPHYKVTLGNIRKPYSFTMPQNILQSPISNNNKRNKILKLNLASIVYGWDDRELFDEDEEIRSDLSSLSYVFTSEPMFFEFSEHTNPKVMQRLNKVLEKCDSWSSVHGITYFSKDDYINEKMYRSLNCNMILKLSEYFQNLKVICLNGEALTCLKYETKISEFFSIRPSLQYIYIDIRRDGEEMLVQHNLYLLIFLSILPNLLTSIRPSLFHDFKSLLVHFKKDSDSGKSSIHKSIKFFSPVEARTHKPLLDQVQQQIKEFKCTNDILTPEIDLSSVDELVSYLYNSIDSFEDELFVSESQSNCVW